jgi:hypothetical protein
MLQMHTDKTKKHSVKNNLPVLKCECGHEISLVPDFKAPWKSNRRTYNGTRKEVCADSKRGRCLGRQLDRSSFEDGF